MEFAQIGEMIGLASSAAGATGKAADTIQTIKGLFQSGSEPDTDQAAKLLNALATELTAANMMNVEVSTALKALSQELYKQDEFEKEKGRYELYRTRQNDMVFKLKTDQSNGQPDHFICPVCLNRDKLVSFIVGEGDYKICQTDRSHHFKFDYTPMQF
ncbi:MAG: hypothetical protein ABJF86_10420 [Tateyamaria sp.]|uniref:hypothetical protein n=1 Tax=Tateyamaria sp. TaxID=1929288 RepID=UPI00327EF521